MSKTGVGLSNLPDGWEVKTLGEVTDIFKGGTPKRNVERYFQGDIAWAIPTDITKLNGSLYIDDTETHISEEALGKSSARLLPAGTVLLTSRATIGKVAITKIPIATNQGFANFLCKEAVANVFLAYYLRSITDLLISLGGGTTFLEVTKKTLLNVEIPLPPLSEQHRIVTKIEELLTKLDAGINELHKAQSQLTRYRQSVLKAAFEGKLTEAWRAEHQEKIETASVLLECILKKRREKWEAEQLEQMKAKGKMPKDDRWKAKYKEPIAPDMSDLLKLPKGWVWATVEQLLTKIQYGSSKKTGDDSNGVPVLRMGNIVDGKITLNNLKYLPKEHDEFPELLLTKGDLLFNRTNSRELVGKTAVYTGIPDPCSFASYLIRVRFNPRINSMIVAYYINSVYGKNWILSVVSQQAGQANVNGTKLKLLAVPIPPEKEQQVLVEEVERYLSIANEVEKTVTAELKRAEQLRQSILKKAFSGKLVPQDPNDEPTSVLLERIKSEKEIVF